MLTSNQTPIAEWSLQPVIEWLFSSGCMMKDDTKFVHELAHQLIACGAPIDQLRVTMRTLNPEIIGASCFWMKSTDLSRHMETQRGVSETDRYIGSPMQQL